MKVAKRRDKIPIGVIYRQNKPIFHKNLYGNFNPVLESLSREKRLEKIENLLKVK